MKIKMLVLLLSSILLVQCDKNDEEMLISGNFLVSIENVMEESTFFASGVFNTPDGASEPGGAGPGHAYVFTFNAGRGSRLSFSTMFVGSNDLFFGPDENGLELFNGDSPVSGDMTSKVYLWDAGALFTPGMAAPDVGLESLAEDGNPGGLNDFLSENSGLVSPLAPGAWAVHSPGSRVLFSDNMSDYGEGLEGLAEDGDPSTLLASLGSKSEVAASGVFNTPAGSSGPGPLFPGSKYEFTFTSEEGQWLSFASMFVQSNDLFFSIGSESGIALWNNGAPLSGDITSHIMLWDAGTEVNEYPGAGLHQPPRINGGMTEGGVVKKVNDGFSYPSVSEVIKVTITPL